MLRRVVAVDGVHEVARHEGAPARARVGDRVVPLRVARRSPPAARRHDDHRRRAAAVDQAVEPLRQAEREEAVGRAGRAVQEVERGQRRAVRAVRGRQVDERAHAVLERPRPERAHDDRALRRRRRCPEWRARPADGREHERRDADAAAHRHIMTPQPESPLTPLSRASQPAFARPRLRYRAGDAAAPALPPQRPSLGRRPHLARQRAAVRRHRGSGARARLGAASRTAASPRSRRPARSPPRRRA